MSHRSLLKHRCSVMSFDHNELLTNIYWIFYFGGEVFQGVPMCSNRVSLFIDFVVEF